MVANHDTVASIFGRPGYWQSRAERLERENAELRARVAEVTSDQSYVIGWNAGFANAVDQELQDKPEAFAAALRAAAELIQKGADR